VGDYDNIQDAIDAANNGDTIWVKDGSYNGQLSINKEVKIIADNGVQPKIYVSSYSPGIDVSANASLEGFKIYGNSNPFSGPTIQLSTGSDNSKIKNNEITAIPSEQGNTAIGITANVNDVEIQSNTIFSYSVGISLDAHATAVVSNNIFNTVSFSIHHAASILETTYLYGSIQDAIDAADAEDIIGVTFGVFQENVVINKSLTLRGTLYDENPVEGRTGYESTINGNTDNGILVSSGTSNVIINGFNITVPNKTAATNKAGILLENNVNNITITNNIIQDITDGGGADNLGDETYGVMVYGRDALGGQENITISNNYIFNVEEYGIAINDKTSRVTITGNKITDLIESDHSADPYWDPSWPDIICSAVHLGGQIGPIDLISIHQNILMSNQIGDGTTTPAGAGISFAGVDEWDPPNTPWQGFSDVVITENIISNNTMGIVSLTGFSNGSILANDNNLSGNSEYGINNIVSDFEFTATDNWWGSITGPFNLTDNPDGTGDKVWGNITFWPWFEFDTYSIPPVVEYTVGIPNARDESIISTATEIEISATDSDSGIHSLTYRIWNPSSRWGPWMNYTESITMSDEGNHILQYNATDNAGTTNIQRNEHRVDASSPEIWLNYPNGGESVSGPILIQWTAADKIVDQSYPLKNETISLTEDYPGHIQSFIPTEDTIDSVQLYLMGDDANVSVKLFSEIFPVPSLIAQSTRHLTAVNPSWVDFPFDSTITLEEDQVYYIGITQQIYGNTGFKWYYSNSTETGDDYQFGHAWIKETDRLVNKSTLDFAFKTMYWDTDISITIQYSMTGVAPWSTIAEGENNDGVYLWNTEFIPDASTYRVRILAEDTLHNVGMDQSDLQFEINNGGPSISDITITDTSVDSTEYCKNGDNIKITATITGDPTEITADLSNFGGGSSVIAASYTASTARWNLADITCTPPDGRLMVTIHATDSTGDMQVKSTSIISDNTPPEITISRPGPGLYLFDGMQLLPFAYPFIIGQITIIADAEDEGSGINKVEFYLENDLEHSAVELPYSWTWDRAASGFFDLEVKAYDQVEQMSTDVIHDIFIINLDIIGHN